MLEERSHQGRKAVWPSKPQIVPTKQQDSTEYGCHPAAASSRIDVDDEIVIAAGNMEQRRFISL